MKLKSIFMMLTTVFNIAICQAEPAVATIDVAAKEIERIAKVVSEKKCYLIIIAPVINDGTDDPFWDGVTEASSDRFGVLQKRDIDMFFDFLVKKPERIVDDPRPGETLEIYFFMEKQITTPEFKMKFRLIKQKVFFEIFENDLEKKMLVEANPEFSNFIVKKLSAKISPRGVE